MKKFILSAILICGFLLSDAQKTTGGNYTYIAQRYEWLAGVFKALGLPAGSGPAAFIAGQEPRAGAVYYDSLGADAGFYIWTGTAWALQGSPAAAELPDELIQPGYVIYSGTGLKFYITPSLARIDGVIYGTTYDSVTLAASDPTNPRKDVIYVATTGIEVLEGTPAGPASEPQLDGGQIKLTVVDVPALATTPGISISVIYDENTEWAITNSGTTTDPDQAAIVYRLTKATEVTSLTNDDRIFATNGSTVNLNAYNSISGFIKLKANMSGAANLRLRFFNGATVISNEVTIAINKLTTDWQAFSIPMTDFNFTGNTFADIVQIRYTGSAAHTGFYLDYFHFETGLLQPGSSTELAIGPIDGKTANQNGATIDNGYFYQQTASQTNPGLFSPADKTKLDSLHSDYFIIPEGDGEPLVTQPNDSTAGIKSLKAGTNVTLDVTDTTVTINSTGGGSQTLQQTFDMEVGGSILTKIDTINFNNNTMRWLKMNTLLMRGDSTISTLPLLIQMYQNTGNTAKFTRDGTSTNTVSNDIVIQRLVQGVGEAGLGAKVTLEAESSTAGSPVEIGSFAARYVNPQHWSVGSSGESEIFMTGFRGVATLDTFMNIQKDVVRINNNADTLATLQDVRDGGGGGGTTANLRIDRTYGGIPIHFIRTSDTTLITKDIVGGTGIDVTTLTDSTNQVAINSSVATLTGTQTLTNKRWVARVGSTTSAAEPTINTDNVDIYKLTAQSADITSFTTNLTGTPNDGDILEIQITGTAARAITWGASFVSSTVTLPSTTVTTATLTVIFQYYTTSSYGNNTWVCVNFY